MAVEARYLVDQSALARVHQPTVAARLEPLFLSGEIATCGIVDLEVLFSARSLSDYLAILADRQSLAHAEVGEAGIEVFLFLIC